MAEMRAEPGGEWEWERRAGHLQREGTPRRGGPMRSILKNLGDGFKHLDFSLGVRFVWL